MPQSLSRVYLHIIFSTKNREHLIRPELEVELYPYLGGIIKNQRAIPIKINGSTDHIHILTTIPRTVSISKFLEEIKRSSSKWIKTKGAHLQKFSWQGGYGVFSVSESQVPKVISYIENQKEHHKQITFKKEFKIFLDNHNVEYNEEYI